MTCPSSCPNKFWCLVSGGKDSLTTAHVLASQGKLAGIVHMDTGIATPDLLPFVKETCAKQGWVLEVYRTPCDYDEMVCRFGFPGPQQHGVYVNSLKGRCIRAFKKAHPGEALASGARKLESKRRLRNVRSEPSYFEGVLTFAPLFDWSTERVWKYVKDNHIEVSPTYKTLHISGDCLCGAFARREEIYMLELFYPELAQRLRSLEERIAREGKIRAVRGRTWGSGGKMRGGFTAAKQQSKIEQFLCHACSTDRGLT